MKVLAAFAAIGILVTVSLALAVAQEDSADPVVSPPADADTPTLPEVVVTGEDETDSYVDDFLNGSSTTLGFPFISPAADGYLAPSATTGTGIDVPFLSFPGSVETVTRDLLDDQQSLILEDVIRNVSGVYVSDGGGGVNDKVIMRGFEIDGNSNDFRKNGFRDSSRVQRETANVERIEFLKGPASVLYGAAGQPSGLINYITKQPLDYRYRDARIRFGSWDSYRFTLDSTGPFLNHRDSLYRLNLAWQDAGSYRDFVSMERFFISPVWQYRLDEATTLSFELEWLHDERVPDRGIPYYQGSFQAVPISRFLGEPTDFSRSDDGQVGVRLRREVHPDLAWQIGYVSNWSQEHRYNVEPVGKKLQGTEVKRRLKDDHVLDSDHFFIGNVSGEWLTGCVNHRFLLGTELGVTLRDKDAWEGNGTNLDIFNPVYGLPQSAPNKMRLSDVQDAQYGLYAQDLIEIGPRLKALAGLRWDSYQGRRFDTRNTPQQASANESALNPRFGLVLQPFAENLSLYAGYSESFDPQFGFTRLGAPLIPERGQMYETGIKLELLQQKLLLNIAGFDVFERNVGVTDPVDTDFSLQVGKVESKGVEMDIVGYLTDRWSLVANCAYLDIHITEDTDPALEGNRLPNVPFFGGSLWTRYNLLHGCCESLGVATGVVYRGERQGDVENTYQLPAYARWDGGIYYHRDSIIASLYIENLLDTFYVASARSQVANIPGTPFNLAGTIQVLY